MALWGDEGVGVKESEIRWELGVTCPKAEVRHPCGLASESTSGGYRDILERVPTSRKRIEEEMLEK